MSSLSRVAAFAAAAFVVSSLVFESSASAQFATTVVQFSPGPSANPSFPAANVLGGPQGGGLFNGSLDVCVLGVGGSITLGFAQPILDGPGADFLAFENGFTAGGATFAEVAAVEVSTDGVHFARLPNAYAGPPAPQPAFGTIPMGTFAGLVGGMPILTNVVTNAIDPRDPVVAGGEAFDLAELAQDPFVTGGLLDLADVHFVRIVDVPAGTVQDSSGAFIFDNGGASGSADIDAVAVVHDATTDLSHAPVCDLRIDSLGLLHVDLGDPDGFYNLDLPTLGASFDLAPFSFLAALPVFAITSFDGKVAHLVTGPVTGSGIVGAFAVSVKDKSGRFSGDQVMVQG